MLPRILTPSDSLLTLAELSALARSMPKPSEIAPTALISTWASAIERMSSKPKPR